MPPAYGTCEPLVDQTIQLTSETFLKSQRTPLIRRTVTTYLIPKRYIFSLLSFTACCLAVSFNINLSIAIVSMVKHKTTQTLPASSNTSLEIFIVEDSNRLDWNAKIESFALGAVYYGQLVSFIPGGRMAELYGGKRMLILCTLIASLSTMILPLAASCNPYAFIVARIGVGIGTGPIIPIIFYMLARWIPEHERSFHASFILSGYGIGSFLAVIVSGAMCGSTFFKGWPSVFYVGAVCGILWCFICSRFMYETPDIHPFISQEEYSYIISNVGCHEREKIQNIPWKDMLLSVPVWALAIGFFGQFWLLGFFSTVHALYMGIVLKLPMIENGILSCLPHLLRAIATCLVSYPVDLLLKRRAISVGFVRKGATLINTVVSCGAFLGITFVGCNVTATTVLFILGGILGEFVTFGVCLACIDIAPNLSGTVSGVLNIVGVFPFFIIPALVGWLTNYESSTEKWKKVFYTTIAIVSASTAIFVIFGDLNPQAWGMSRQSKGDNNTEDSDVTERTDLIVTTLVKDPA